MAGRHKSVGYFHLQMCLDLHTFVTELSCSRGANSVTIQRQLQNGKHKHLTSLLRVQVTERGKLLWR